MICVGIAADRRARLVEAIVALPDLLARAVRIPAVGVAGGDTQHPRPVRAEGDRWPRSLQRRGAERRVVDLVIPALPCGDVLGQQCVDQHDRFLEAPDQLRGLRKGHAEPLVLGLVPAGADPQLQPAPRDVIDRHRLLGEQRRVAEGVAAHQDADARFLGLQRQRRQQRPAFEKRRFGETRPLVVIGVPDRVEPELARTPASGGRASATADSDCERSRIVAVAASLLRRVIG